MRKVRVALLLLLNLLVLLGQVWPEGAPPFASVVNILTLVLNAAFLLGQMWGNGKSSEMDKAET